MDGGMRRLKGAMPDYLTPRQAEIVRLLAEGLKVPAIVETLGVSANTVHNHCDTIYRVLGVNNAGAVAARYWRLRVDAAREAGRAEGRGERFNARHAADMLVEETRGARCPAR